MKTARQLFDKHANDLSARYKDAMDLGDLKMALKEHDKEIKDMIDDMKEKNEIKTSWANYKSVDSFRAYVDGFHSALTELKDKIK